MKSSSDPLLELKEEPAEQKFIKEEIPFEIAEVWSAVPTEVMKTENDVMQCSRMESAMIPNGQ